MKIVADLVHQVNSSYMVWIIVIIVLIFTFIVEFILFKGFYKAVIDKIEDLRAEEPLINSKIYDIKHSLETTNSIIIPVKIKERIYRFLIDTGSTHCILDVKHLRENTENSSPSNTCSIFGIEGIEKKFDTYTIETEILDRKFLIPMSIMELPKEVSFDGILGSNFLEEAGYIIDFKNKTIIHDKNSNRKS